MEMMQRFDGEVKGEISVVEENTENISVCFRNEVMDVCQRSNS